MTATVVAVLVLWALLTGWHLETEHERTDAVALGLVASLAIVTSCYANVFGIGVLLVALF